MNKATYDPVPPYELDVEGQPVEEVRDQPTQQPLEESNVQIEEPVQIQEPAGQHLRPGKLSEKECCVFGLAYTALVVFGIVLVVKVVH